MRQKVGLLISVVLMVVLTAGCVTTPQSATDIYNSISVLTEQQLNQTAHELDQTFNSVLAQERVKSYQLLRQKLLKAQLSGTATQEEIDAAYEQGMNATEANLEILRVKFDAMVDKVETSAQAVQTLRIMRTAEVENPWLPQEPLTEVLPNGRPSQ